MFTNAFTRGAYAVSELSFSNFMRLTAAGECPYVGLPVFPSRSFRHSAWYVRPDGEIGRPEDLRGRRVGVREYSMTAAVVGRGVLADEHNIEAREIHWVIGDVETVNGSSNFLRTGNVNFPSLADPVVNRVQ
ncbi:MAG: hypothetical protein AAFY39_08165 [Pseudomonadota bacterium]